MTVAAAAWAQDAPTPQRAKAQADIAAEAAAQPPKTPSIKGIAAQSLMPGQWTIVNTQVENPTTEPLQARVIFRFTDESGQKQFVREISLPPQSIRIVPIPVRAPSVAPGDTKGVDSEAILIAADAERELNRVSGSMIFLQDPTQYMAISDNARLTDEAGKVMTSLRKRQGLATSVTYLRSDAGSRYDVGYDAANTIGVMASELYFDAAQQQAMQSWLAAGGNLLVFADQTNLDAMRRLLPGAWTIEEVDTITLNVVQFKRAAAAVDPAELTDGSGDGVVATVDVEDPIVMRRIVAPGFKTLLTVNGFPALLQRDYGRGSIVVVTVGGRAWTHNDAGPALSQINGLLAAGGPVGAFDEPSDLLAQPAATQFVTDQIGYKIVPRSILAIILIGFAAAVIVGVFLWWRKGRLEYLGILGAGAAIVATIVLVVIGQQQRQEIPGTAAELQLVQTQSGEVDANVQGMLGMYHPRGAQVQLTGDQGGYAWPSASGGGIVRINSADLNQWQWPSLDLPSGTVQPLMYDSSASLQRPLSMSLRFDAQGLSGTVNWPDEVGEPADLLIVTPSANLRVHTQQQGQTTTVRVSAAEDVMARSVVQGGAVLGQAQQNRAVVLEPLLSQMRFDEPMLLAWTKGLPTGIGVEPELEHRSEALWMVPLKIEPSAGGKVRVPWPMIEMEQVRDPKQTLKMPLLPIYQRDRRQFIDQIAGASSFVGRFQLPKQVLPIELTGGRIHMDMTAIGRPVRVMIRAGEQWLDIARFESPDGGRVIDIPADVLSKATIDDQGGVLVGFHVDHPAAGTSGERTSDMWTVRQFALEIEGNVQAAENREDAKVAKQ